jgi:integrase
LFHQSNHGSWYLKRAAAAGIGWPLTEGWDQRSLEQVLFQERRLPQQLPEHVLPDFSPSHQQLQQHPLLFVNRNRRAFSANKLREKQLHPLLERLGIPRGGFHSMRHGAASALLADGATPAVVQRQLRHSDPRITLGIYGHVVGSQQRDAVENRAARPA